MSKFTGVIERLFVNDRKTAKGDKKSISIANNKIYYGLGLHDTDTYQVGGVILKDGWKSASVMRMVSIKMLFLIP
jgi:hypothetical protein